MFWERFSDLCSQRNSKPNPVAKEIGVSSGIVSKWKNLGTLPSGETLQKIADYFDCSVDYLLGRTASPSVGSVGAASAADSEETNLLLQLDIEDRAEVRGIMKQMLRADKYTVNADAARACIAELQQRETNTARMVALGGNSALVDTANPTPEEIERAKAILAKTTSK